MKNASTSWGGVADWYDDLLEEEAGTYQKELILPNLLRLLEIKKGDQVLDLACGQGFFSRAFAGEGANVTGIEIAPELVAHAKAKAMKNIAYHVAAAESIPFVDNASVDKAVIVLAIQNIEGYAQVFKECARVLKPGGHLYVVLNHPAFRVPKASSWGFDSASETPTQYRRVDEYISERKTKIQMHPGGKPGAFTVSFHRPLQAYVKALNKAGFKLSRLEEWTSHKKSQEGPRAQAEDKARKEIPIFMLLEVEL